jgi:hypothetical protein
MFARNIAAMISSEVQRTLVKSPPELWAELSDPAALARHLGELGEIRIVRTAPESTVEWTAENTTGTVSIKPSAWGTKVTLSVTREIAERALQPEAGTERALQPEAGTERAPAQAGEPEPAPAAEVAPIEARAPAARPAPEARRGFFARLFGRRQRAETQAYTPAPERPPDAPDAFAAVRQALAPETFATAHPFAALPDVKPAPECAGPECAAPEPPARDLSAELMAAEEVAAEEVTAVLTAVLDRLGAAHHRPFSRA